jgi:hypothetical protein
MADVFKDKSTGKGTAQVYPAGADQAWKIAVQIFRWDGAGTIEEHREQNLMLTTVSTGGSSFYRGDAMSFVGAWIEPVDGGRTRVTCVVSEPGIPASRSFSEAGFHQRFQQALALLQSGRPLPVEAPPAPAPDSRIARCDTSSDCEAGTCIEHGCRR